MKKTVMSLAIGCLLVFGGCVAAEKALNKIAPNQTRVVSTTDPVTGITSNSVVEIAGTHTATPLTADTAAAIPYGSIALSILLLGVNFIQKYQADKVGKGLKSTVQAIEMAGEYPSMAPQIAKLKLQLANAHQIAGVQPIIQDILAKI